MPPASIAADLVKSMRANGGLAPADLERFWADDEAAHADPFGAAIPQVPLGIRMGMECVFAELGIPEDWYRLEHDEAWRLELARAYNDRAEPIVGRRLLNEVVSPLVVVSAPNTSWSRWNHPRRIPT